ncbi:MAG: glycosyltransferase [Microbacterium sp.]|nr:glycosyltransferase [Microbacterium sp.]
MVSSDRKTVLVVHPGAEMFGSDRMLLESAIGLVETGARVVVALPHRGLLDTALRAAGAEVVIVPMLVLRKMLLTPRGLPRLFRDTFRGLGAAWRLLGRIRPDAVYVSTIIVPQWPALARLRGARTVSHLHEAEGSGARIVNALLYLPHLASHLTIANSRFTLDTVARTLPALARRSTVILNGVHAPADPAPARPELDGPLRIVYVGRLSARKGPDLAVEAAALLAARGHDARVTLVGAVFEGYEWYEQQLHEQAAATGVDVEFAGFQTEVWPFVSASDVLVVPSRSDESFGNTVVEGVLAERPVIASDSSGLREGAADYRTVQLVRPDDAEAIAAALDRVREEWPALIAELPAAREAADRRHAPAVYRAAVAAAVLGD